MLKPAFVRVLLLFSAPHLLCQITHAQVLLKLTDIHSEELSTPVMDAAGTTVFVNHNTDTFGPNHPRAWQLGVWNTATGLGSPLIDDPDGVSWMRRTVDVSADGEWLAFVSSADLTGQNHDESQEIFVTKPDGSILTQLTNNPGPANTSWIYRVAIDGDGDRIAFIADTDPLGSNPDRLPQVFAIDRDGSSPIQLTSVTPAEQGDDLGALAGLDVDISDAGTAVLFKNDQGVFAVLDDGTNRVEIENAGINPYLAGNGLHAVSELDANAVVVDPWTSVTELSQRGSGPSITAEGGFVVFSDNRQDPNDNPEGNHEIWRASLDGSVLTPITSTSSESNIAPVVSGDGSRIAFSRLSSPSTFHVADFRGNEIQLAEYTADSSSVTSPDITPDGSRVVYSLDGDLMRFDPDEGEHKTVLAGDFFADELSVTGDGETIFFVSTGDPLGVGNPSLAALLYAVEADGTNVRLLTPSFVFPPGSGYWIGAKSPDVASNGSWVVFVAVDSHGQIGVYRVRPSGTDLMALTPLSLFGPCCARIDDNGEWVVFAHDGIWRVRSDGTGLDQIVAAGPLETVLPDISGDGQQIVWTGHNDPLGTNPDGNREIFRYDVPNGTIHQVTETTGRSSYEPVLSRDGAWIYFASSVPFFDENPQNRAEWYRYEIATGRLERAGGIRRGPTDVPLSSQSRIAVDATGRRAVFVAGGDWNGRNPDHNDELYLIDHAKGSRIEAEKQAPAVVAWDADPRYVRYDLVRGDLANVGYDEGTIALGPVTCLEQASPDTDTRGFEDPLQPEPGQVLFYVYRGTQGMGDTVNDWGFATGGLERVPGTGACTP